MPDGDHGDANGATWTAAAAAGAATATTSRRRKRRRRAAAALALAGGHLAVAAGIFAFSGATVLLNSERLARLRKGYYYHHDNYRDDDSDGGDASVGGGSDSSRQRNPAVAAGTATTSAGNSEEKRKRRPRRNRMLNGKNLPVLDDAADVDDILADLPAPIRIMERYKKWHSADVLRSELGNSTSSDVTRAATATTTAAAGSSSSEHNPYPRGFVVGYYRCPHEAGNKLHNFFNRKCVQYVYVLERGKGREGGRKYLLCVLGRRHKVSPNH